jgi:hypothetical protein
MYQPVLNVDRIKITPTEITSERNKFQNAVLIQFQDSLYYRCELKPTPKTYAESDAKESKWKKKTAPIPDVVYINAASNTIAKDLDAKYAEFLAHYFDGSSSGMSSCCDGETYVESKICSIEKAKLLEIKVLTDFDSREYGFVNKRLPVVKLAYDTPEKTTYFVETATSRIASIVRKSDRVEGYSFAILHKFLWMDWAGKPIRDLVMTFAAIALFLLTVLGLRMLVKK